MPSSPTRLAGSFSRDLQNLTLHPPQSSDKPDTVGKDQAPLQSNPTGECVNSDNADAASNELQKLNPNQENSQKDIKFNNQKSNENHTDNHAENDSSADGLRRRGVKPENEGEGNPIAAVIFKYGPETLIPRVGREMGDSNYYEYYERHYDRES
jgi:hypothetical protein